MRQSITDRNLHKINLIYNPNNTTILWFFFTHFDFESVLSSDTHSWPANIYYSYAQLKLPVFAKLGRQVDSDPFFLSHLSPIFSPLHDKHFHTDEKVYCRIDESVTLLYNSIHRLVSRIDKECDEFILFFLVFFSRENYFFWSTSSLCITAWFSLGTSGEATSWITLVSSLVCGD